ncbi:unnamed protein product [Schistocephalus solidus]|uniref:C2H2-type domain-containing protein n=1 Tax=Schistocephalus solidus TaxID=70667 RepID=A0A183SGT0_SCHSO|nr:unnamed protein product [Schistocephalus solidus]
MTAEFTAMSTEPIPHAQPTLLQISPPLPPHYHNPSAPPDFSCPRCARNFTSRIDLVSLLRFHRTEAGEPTVRPS